MAMAMSRKSPLPFQKMIVLIWVISYLVMSCCIETSAFLFAPSPLSSKSSLAPTKTKATFSHRHKNPIQVSASTKQSSDSSSSSTTSSFDKPIFPGIFNDEKTQTLPTKNSNMDIVLPDFDVLFERICAVSPLTRRIIEGRRKHHEKRTSQQGGGGGDLDEKEDFVHVGGINDIEDAEEVLPWKTTTDSRKKKQKDNKLPTGILEIDKVDHFRNLPCPLLRFRVRQRGPSDLRGYAFAHLITDTKARARWDPNIDLVYECHEAENLMDATLAMSRHHNNDYNHNQQHQQQKQSKEIKEDDINKVIHDFKEERFGRCYRFGIGYVRTKKNIVSPREQLTLCGVQHFPESNSWTVWGIEMDEKYNHLFPQEQGEERLLRSKSHLFLLTVVPTPVSDGDEEEDGTLFDIEYVVQLEVGSFPAWLSGPVVAETVKGFFRYSEKWFKAGLDPNQKTEEGSLLEMISSYSNTGEDESATDVLKGKESLLLTP